MKPSTIDSLKARGWESTRITADDTRKIQELQPVLKLADVQANLSKHASTRAGMPTNNSCAVQLPKNNIIFHQKDGNNTFECSQDPIEVETVLPALCSAKKTLVCEHPVMYDNMNKTKEYLKIKRNRRRKKFDSQGIFDTETNNIRARTIYRVEMNRGFSKTKLSDKAQDFRDLEVDWSDTLPGRLERMYLQVLDTINTYKRRRRQCFVDNRGKMKIFLAIASEKSPRLLRKTSSFNVPDNLKMSSRQSSSPMKEEHCRQLVTAQEAHVSRYRDMVASKRDQILHDLGVDPVTPWTIEQVLTKLEEHLKKRCEEETSRLQHKDISPSSLKGKSLHVAENTAAILTVALEQIAQAQETIDAFSVHPHQQQVENRRYTELNNMRQPSTLTSSSNEKVQISDEMSPSSAARLSDADAITDNSADNIRPRKMLPGQHPFDCEELKDRSEVNVIESQRLKDCCEIEATAVPVPMLPDIRIYASRTSSGDLSEIIVARLERLWFILRMPLASRVDMVIKYTSNEDCATLEQALDQWDMAAAALLHRENLLGQLVEIRNILESSANNTISRAKTKELCKSFVKSSKRVHEMRERLLILGDDLTFEGDPYPGPGELKEQDLEKFIELIPNENCSPSPSSP